MTSSENETLEELRSTIRGTVITASDPGYDAARSIWNAMIDRRPSAIVQAVGTQDVVEAVNYARNNNRLLSIKGGGHNISGLAVCDDGLTLDMSQMRGVWVDRAAHTARAQVGCTLGDVDRETQVHGLAAVLGFVSKTGITGLTLGGGFGYLSRQYGYTSDNVLSMDVVTAQGRVVRASETENPDLFWGLRGGGGNFGVVTGIEYKLYPVGPEVMAGAIAWPAEDAGKVLELYHGMVEKAPTEFTLVAILRIAPPAPWLSPDIHGKPVVVLVACHSGPVEEGKKLVAPIKDFGTPVGDVIQPRPYVTQQSLLDATQPKGRRYYWKSMNLPELSDAAIDRFVQNALDQPSPLATTDLWHIGGAVRRIGEEDTAFAGRNARFLFAVEANWEDPRDDDLNITWARESVDAMREFSDGSRYFNFPGLHEEGEEIMRDTFGAKYQRLVALKNKYDPTNLFRLNQNIKPAV